jgi:hypothetical protein
LRARLWDRFFDQYVATPMQKIVGDQLRPAGRADPAGVADARSTLDTPTRCSTSIWPNGPGRPALRSPWPVRRRAGAVLHARRPSLGRGRSRQRHPLLPRPHDPRFGRARR